MKQSTQRILAGIGLICLGLFAVVGFFKVVLVATWTDLSVCWRFFIGLDVALGFACALILNAMGASLIHTRNS